MFRATMAVSDQVLAGRRRGQGSEWVLYHFVLTTPLIEHDAVQQSVVPALSRNPVPGGCTQTGWLWASRAPLSALIWRHHSELVLYRIYHTHMKDAALPAPS